MKSPPSAGDVAAALRVGLGVLVRRLRQAQASEELTLPETSALSRLERCGPTTVTELAKLEQISSQSMGATLAALEARGLVARKPDPDDGRRVVVSITGAGRDVVRNRRSERVSLLARALEDGFTPAELRTLADAAPLLERLAQHL
ncbi:MAG TPA: MarR family transcriptional regulator [Candidatus Sulfotelmatobacter sp.]|nr:MarR family transcriptional regulator [Candidatus Sulfotelmatobacter sp.]